MADTLDDMLHEPTTTTIVTVIAFFAMLLGFCFWMARKRPSTGRFLSAGGKVHWLFHSFALFGGCLAAAFFLPITGDVAARGLDGFYYAAAYLAGWLIAGLFLLPPIRRMGRHSLASALHARFQSNAVRRAAACTTLILSLLLLVTVLSITSEIARDFIGLKPTVYIALVGLTAYIVVATAGMASITFVQVIAGASMLCFALALTGAALQRGYTLAGEDIAHGGVRIETEEELVGEKEILETNEYWRDLPYLRTLNRTNRLHPDIWRRMDDGRYAQTQQKRATVDREGRIVYYFNGRSFQAETPGTLHPFGSATSLPGDRSKTGSIPIMQFASIVRDSNFLAWRAQVIEEGPTVTTTVYYPRPFQGREFLQIDAPQSLSGDKQRLEFFSLLLAIVVGIACLPHITKRSTTVRSSGALRISFMLAAGWIALMLSSMIMLGISALTNGALDPGQWAMSLPLLAKQFGAPFLAAVTVVSLAAVVATCSAMLLCAGSAAGDMIEPIDDDRAAISTHRKNAFLIAGAVIGLSLLLPQTALAATDLLAGTFALAASALGPTLLLLFWRGATAPGVTASIWIGLSICLLWIAADSYTQLPLHHPALITLPLGMAILVIVSLLTRGKRGRVH